MRKSSDGLVIKEYAVGESDKLLTVLTSDGGKILISAKGVRSMKSKNMSVCRLFSYANFEYYEKNGRYWLATATSIESFFSLNESIEALALASYVVDIVNEISGEGVPDELLLRATLNTLYAIGKGLRPRELIKGAFEFFAAAHSGFLGTLSVCERCEKAPEGSFYLDVMNGSLLCSECLKAKGLAAYDPETELSIDRFATKNVLLPLTKEVLMAINYVITAPIQRLFSFNLTDIEDLRLFSRAGEIYLENHLERGFETLKFYYSVADLELPEPKTERNAK